MMEVAPLLSILLLGFSAGVIHAFDADHIAAVSGISGQNGGRYSFHFALHWGFGHGLAVIAVASLVLLAGAAIPTQFSAMAEAAVAWMLIVIGAMTFAHLWRQHQHQAEAQPRSYNAILVGLVHGSAGSAPLLAVIPAAGMASPTLGMLHILVFNAGLILAMAGVGAALRSGLSAAGRYHHALQFSLQSALGVFATSFGVFLLLSH
ncbi:urease accessory protein UreH [Zhongshania aquimaris]|uniref:Urease accessory protein UreH n=1 Tax=Zhongshania aquimaris TaxID=2857107 RepID=A0ABS6VRG7_9GAMM|nr:urease accessory protein UreH [Zhongshania aquimaris]MBW2940910.1 urease accessory protein UreH [Zhongshania aquimaris]